MAKNLKGNLTSNYWEAAQKMKSKRARRKIVAYVESYEDVAFWRNILGELEDKTRYFQIMLPSARSLTKGKKMALMSALRDVALGGNMIACVDSDYDYLLQDSTYTSQRINQHPYIFQTYVYAVENYHCYAETLREVCTQVTLNDHFLFNFPAFFAQYSRIIYPLFIWNIYFYRLKREKEFCMTDFNACIKVDHFRNRNGQETLNKIQRSVSRQLKVLEERYADETFQVDKLARELQRLGVEEENCYLFVQGHHLMDNVVMKLLVPICTKLRREREDEIQRLAISETHYQNEIRSYHHSISRIESVLQKNFNFKNLLLFQKLKEDLLRFLGKS